MTDIPTTTTQVSSAMHREWARDFDFELLLPILRVSCTALILLVQTPALLKADCFGKKHLILFANVLVEVEFHCLQAAHETGVAVRSSRGTPKAISNAGHHAQQFVLEAMIFVHELDGVAEGAERVARRRSALCNC